MKTIITLMACALFMTGTASAQETIMLPGKKAGDVPFSHEKHQKALDSCKPCHTSEAGGKIEGFNKETAHKLCTDCHKDTKSGPTTCSGCHKQN
ncbi:cytochrome c3 family protein [Geobacter sp. DSM 9736]|uniref:cytochrome c3 family protein n=1 Tax=Geobacter sp. DSM 9736 TaxID=1277350 RepID=UPI000B5003C2|nr:cytochrome c3 family protein [Geobacter sp. DSM 9736]SNB46921.1 hypothetical protein SAMN06269301_2393 [Geobacter sp. DSM 9736]